MLNSDLWAFTPAPWWRFPSSFLLSRCAVDSFSWSSSFLSGNWKMSSPRKWKDTCCYLKRGENRKWKTEIFLARSLKYIFHCCNQVDLVLKRNKTKTENKPLNMQNSYRETNCSDFSVQLCLWLVNLWISVITDGGIYPIATPMPYPHRSVVVMATWDVVTLHTMKENQRKLFCSDAF